MTQVRIVIITIMKSRLMQQMAGFFKKAIMGKRKEPQKLLEKVKLRAKKAKKEMG